MGLSKRSTYIAITVLAALSVEVGCGDGSSHKAPVRKDIAAKTSQPATIQQPKKDEKGNIVKDANGKVVMETVPNPKATANAKPATDANGKVTLKDMNVPETDKNLKTIADAESQLWNRTPVSRDTLVAGKYELQSALSFVHINNTNNITEDTRASLESTIKVDDRGVPQIIDQSKKSTPAGMITNYVDVPRNIDIPSTFPVKLVNGKWLPERRFAANVTFSESVITAKGTAEIKDTLDNPLDSNASLMTILASGNVDGGAYNIVDANGVNIFVRLFKVDGGVTVAMSFEEKRNTGADKNVISMDRKIFFKYKVTPDTTQTAAVDDKINIKQVDTLAPNGPNTGAPQAIDAAAAAEGVGQ